MRYVLVPVTRRVVCAQLRLQRGAPNCHINPPCKVNLPGLPPSIRITRGDRRVTSGKSMSFSAIVCVCMCAIGVCECQWNFLRRAAAPLPVRLTVGWLTTGSDARGRAPILCAHRRTDLACKAMMSPVFTLFDLTQ